MAEHSELVEEMQQIEKLPLLDRVKLAQKRRKQQLFNYTKWIKTESSSKPKNKNRQGITFTNNIQLMEVATRGSYEEMRSLLKSGVDPNIKNHDGLTALHQCCIEGSSEMVALLIKYGVDVNITDQDLWTPLHAAATCGHFKVVTTLIKAGADVTAVNGEGDMPHDITEEEITHQYLINEMIKRDLSEEELNQMRHAPHINMMSDIKSILEANGDLDQPLGGGETLLHVAIEKGYNDIVEMLLDNGASVTVTDGDGWQPVHVASYWCNENALEMLIHNPKVDLRATTRDGETPFELCDDANLKLDILHALRDKRNSDTNSLELGSDDEHVETTNGEYYENAVINTPPRDYNSSGDENVDSAIPSLEDTPSSPFINIDGTDMHSDRRNSIKDVKHNAPLKRQSSDRNSTRERLPRIPSDARRRSLETESLKKEHNSVANHHSDFYEGYQPPVYEEEPSIHKPWLSLDKQPPAHTQESPMHTSQPSFDTQPPKDTSWTFTDTQPPTQAPVPPTRTSWLSTDTSARVPEPPKRTKSKNPIKTTSIITSMDELTHEESGKEPLPGEVLMRRPRKKTHAPPPPRGSLLDLKRQRQEEREHMLQQDKDEAEREVLKSAFVYEPPPSPTMIRYKYKMEDDDDIKQTLFREKKCTVM